MVPARIRVCVLRSGLQRVFVLDAPRPSLGLGPPPASSLRTSSALSVSRNGGQVRLGTVLSLGRKMGRFESGGWGFFVRIRRVGSGAFLSPRNPGLYLKPLRALCLRGCSPHFYVLVFLLLLHFIDQP